MNLYVLPLVNIGLHDAEHAMVLMSGEGSCLTCSIRGYHRWHCSHDAQLTRGSTTDRKEEIQLYRQVTCGNKSSEYSKNPYQTMLEILWQIENISTEYTCHGWKSSVRVGLIGS